MPSKSPRLALTIPDDLKQVLDDLGDAMGKPTSKVVTELLQELSPQLAATAKMVRLAQAGNRAGVKRVLAHMVGDAAAGLLTARQEELPLSKGKGRRG
jgi:hypothetical protein